MARSSRRRRRVRGDAVKRYAVIVAGLLVVASAAYFILAGAAEHGHSKPIILYVNQGNGAVNGSNFGGMIAYAASHGFNTVFFQMYRQGRFLFTPEQLSSFVNESHADGMKIFFSLYITDPSQAIPASIYGDGEDGISLDMSTLSMGEQQALLAGLKTAYHDETAVTTNDLSSTLSPDILVLETYGAGTQQYIARGIVASVGVFATSSEQDYRSQFQYALQNSDGVMVFDYAGLLKKGY